MELLPEDDKVSPIHTFAGAGDIVATGGDTRIRGAVGGAGDPGKVWAGVRVGQAILGGVLAAAAHFLAEFLHQIGHAIAARRTGYPMQGMRFGMLTILALSVYPRDEPDLPARVHIRRALGGPLFSLALGVIVGLGTWFAFGPPLALPEAVLLFFAADSLLVMGVGALLPLGFTDGSTLVRYRRER